MRLRLTHDSYEIDLEYIQVVSEMESTICLRREYEMSLRWFGRACLKLRWILDGPEMNLR